MIPTTYKAVFEVRNDTYTTQANDPNATEWQVEINLGSLMKGDKGDKGDAATITVGTTTAISGTTPAVSVNNSGDEHAAVFDFSFTLPKGDKGDTGNGISNISKTGTAGKVDTYTITYTNTDTDTFTVTNGTDGTNGVAAGFDTPTATVDSNVGTPGVTVSATGPDTAKVFSFAFTNLKGETGDQGPVGRGLEIKGEVVGSWVAPQNPKAGDAYYCTGDGKLHVYDGTAWFTIEMAAGTLDTTAATPQDTKASESLGGSIVLHKISKTGQFSDLILPSGGITAASLSTAVQASLGKADTALQSSDISGKVDKVSSATSGNFAALDGNGNLTDSGHKHSDYLTQHQDISGKADKATTLAGYGITDANISSGTITLGSNTITPLTSHQDIKTINGNTITGTGNVAVGNIRCESADITSIVVLTESAYAALATKVPTTLYILTPDA